MPLFTSRSSVPGEEGTAADPRFAGPDAGSSSISSGLDSTDWKLVHELAEDASRPMSAVAAEVGCDEVEAEERVSLLAHRGIVKDIRARLDPDAMGFPVLAFVMVRMVQNADNYEVVRHMLSEVDQVEEAHALSGQFDWLVKVRARSMQDLQQLVTRRLSIVPGFVRAETLMVLDTACERVNIEAACHPSAPPIRGSDEHGDGDEDDDPGRR